MAVNLFVRKSFKAVALRKAVNEHLDPKIKAIKKDKQLANALATIWAEQVTRFVPRSDEDGHHLQDFYVTDGRVIWRRPARRDEPVRKDDPAQKDDPADRITKGQEIAHILYEGPTKGVFHSRYTGHEPQPHWDQCVVPGTKDWDDFVIRATPTIQDWMKNNG